MRAILWVVRALVVLLALRFLLRLFFSPRVQDGRGSGRRPAAWPQAPGGERVGGDLVRDPHCGTYVARSRAIVVGSGTSALYFCSAACKDAYAGTQHAEPSTQH